MRLSLQDAEAMVANRQQLLVQLFRERPELVEVVLYDLLQVDRWSVHGDRRRVARYGNARPHDTRLLPGQDTAVFVLEDAKGLPAQIVALVVQLEKQEERRQYSWPSYVWSLRDTLHFGNVWLIVVTDDEAVAEWAREPTASGPHWFKPLVLSPGTVPSIGPDKALEKPALTVLSAALHAMDMTYSGSATARARAARMALKELRSPHASDYREMLERPLLTVSAQVLELMVMELRLTNAAALQRTLEQRHGQPLTDDQRALVQAASIAALAEPADSLSKAESLEDALALLEHRSHGSPELGPVEQIRQLLAVPSLDRASLINWFDVELGRQQGLSELVLEQLRVVYEALPSTITDRVRCAGSAQLCEIGLRLLMFGTIQDVLAPLRDRSPDTALDQLIQEFLKDADRDKIDLEIAQVGGIEFDGHTVRCLNHLRGGDMGQRALVHRQLRQRFGPLPAEAAERLDWSTDNKLLEIGVNLLTARTLEEALGCKQDHKGDQAS